ncbi:hypothetical protein [Georgenia alba]|uniref:Helix-hairpin-helix domain-containing protein n=1 Tax=Georgenia alba TaxID=2233858 RepID=A0ABW2Q295_9MICO
MIRPAELDGIRSGAIDLAFRRWETPRVRVGTRMRTAIGLIEVTSLERVEDSALTAEDARRAGAASLAALLRGLEQRSERPVYRVGLRYAGPDPRIALRESVPDADELAGLAGRLARLDRAAADGPWTRQPLELIDEHPGRRAPDLASEVGRPTAEFKRDVRKLKELGLTESLDIGYRLSPRGEAVLDHLTGEPRTDRPERPAGTPLPHVGAAASRALAAAGVTTLEQVAGMREADLLALRGVGPVAVSRLSRALEDVRLAPIVQDG